MELPKVPFYFKNPRENWVCFCHDIDFGRIYYETLHDGFHSEARIERFEANVKEKAWVICDQHGNEIKEKETDYGDYLKDVKVGDKLYSYRFGCGVVVEVKDPNRTTHPIVFKSNSDVRLSFQFSGCGIHEVEPTLFFTKPSFQPECFTLAKQSTTCVRTLIENGVDIEVDTKMVWHLEDNKLNCYFAQNKDNRLFVFARGMTSFSNTGEKPIRANCLYLLEPREYTPKGVK